MRRLDVIARYWRSFDFEVDLHNLRHRGRPDAYIDCDVFFLGNHGLLELALLDTAARDLGGLSRGVVFVDVGAHVDRTEADLRNTLYPGHALFALSGSSHASA